MGRGVNSGTITKEAILNKVSQVSIFSTYFNIPSQIIEHCISTGELIKSPIRTDFKPTCGFRYDNRGKLKFKDFAGYFWGDCFDAVATVMSVLYKREFDVSNGQDFIKILRHITLTFKDIYYGGEKDPNRQNNIYKSLSILRNKKPIIELVIRPWTQKDKEYWDNVGIDLGTLNTEFIYPIDQYYINRKTNPQPKYFYNVDDPCYGYLLGKDKFGINNIKLYFPKRDKSYTRFITNCNHLEGIYTLDRKDYDVIFVTKSTKDRVALKCHIKQMQHGYKDIKDVNIGVINIPHETYKLRQVEYDWLQSKLSKDGIILSLMDNDSTGINEAYWLKDNFDINVILIPRRYESKDFAELKQNQPFDEISELILMVIKRYKHYDKNSQFDWDTKPGDTLPF